MKIGDLARATGVDLETVRYYERIKLLSAPKRLPNGYRAYSEHHLERLAFIRHCRALDMPLADIRLLLDFMAEPPGDCSAVNRAVDAQLDRVRARLKSLRALEKQLTALRSQCRRPRGRRECGILHELVAAAHAEACACHAGGPSTRASRD
ncbi:MAG TPA: Cd(II)/Pb(II)-responsive transcriptional regulator [Burkholderiales bacterium]|nr:Cd(II)/Pb(II)-responsive transcriptional regulator [Burkholderiales bacterium]